MEIRHLSSSASAEDLATVLGEDGAAIVDCLVEPAVLDRAKRELDPFLAATPFGPDSFAGRRTRRTGALIARSETCRDLVVHPLVLGAVDKVLSHSSSFQLHLTQVISIDPGEPAQKVHRDQWAFAFFPFPRGYEVSCNTLWALTDFTEANGATRVIPGSHRLEDRLELDAAETVPAEMKKGSVLIYTGSLYHGAGANRSDHTRRGINITYSVSWLRQEENQYLAVPLETARTLPVDLLRLMGYSRGAYALGYVDDLRDPIEVVRPDLGSTGLGDLRAALEQARSR